MSSRLEDLVAYLAGHDGPAVDVVRASLTEDPSGEASQVLTATQALSQHALGEHVLRWLGLPAVAVPPPAKSEPRRRSLVTFGRVLPWLLVLAAALAGGWWWQENRLQPPEQEPGRQAEPRPPQGQAPPQGLTLAPDTPPRLKPRRPELEPGEADLAAPGGDAENTAAQVLQRRQGDTEAQAARPQLVRLQSDLKAALAQLSAAQGELEKKKSLATALQTARAEIARLEKEGQTARSQLAAAQAELQKLKGQAAALQTARADVTRLEREVTTAREQVARLTAELKKRKPPP
jgi:DNA repair exonuclease SbcCD ATPase subunit